MKLRYRANEEFRLFIKLFSVRAGLGGKPQGKGDERVELMGACKVG